MPKVSAFKCRGCDAIYAEAEQAAAHDAYHFLLEEAPGLSHAFLQILVSFFPKHLSAVEGAIAAYLDAMKELQPPPALSPFSDGHDKPTENSNG